MRSNDPRTPPLGNLRGGLWVGKGGGGAWPTGELQIQNFGLKCIEKFSKTFSVAEISELPTPLAQFFFRMSGEPWDYQFWNQHKIS